MRSSSAPRPTCMKATSWRRSRPTCTSSCERPLAMNAASAAQRIVKAAEKKNKVVMVDMNHRYRADAQLVRSFVQSGELGQVDSVRGSWHVFRPSRQQAALAAAARPVGWRCPAGPRASRCSTWACGWRAIPTAGACQRHLGKAVHCDRGVERSGSAFVVCDNGASIFFDVTWHHLGEGERFGIGPARGARRCLDQSAHGVEGIARGRHGRLTHAPRAAGRMPMALVAPGGVGPLPCGGGGSGEGNRTWASMSRLHQASWTRSTSRRKTVATWHCEAGLGQEDCDPAPARGSGAPGQQVASAPIPPARQPGTGLRGERPDAWT